jgi:glycine cleavage system H protein
MALEGKMLYSKEHVWVSMENGSVKIGLSDFAQSELGELTFIELPEPGSHFNVSEVICSIDSLKAASDIYAPISGTVTEVNTALNEPGGPRLVNREPTGIGWLLAMKPDKVDDMAGLLSPEDYTEYTGG